MSGVTFETAQTYHPQKPTQRLHRRMWHDARNHQQATKLHKLLHKHSQTSPHLT